MRVLFLTNQASYHQMQFAQAMAHELGIDSFRIVFQKPTSDARAEMGWLDDYQEPFILRYWQQTEEVHTWIEQADVVIQGRFPTRLVKARIKAGKLTLTCQERLWKKPPSVLRKLSRLGHFYKNYWSVDEPNYHFLAIGRYAAQDLNQLGFFKGRSWQYGYFIDAPDMPTSKVGRGKDLSLLWCARMSEVKQPWRALDVLKGLRDRGMDARLTMIGDGDLRSQIEHSIQQRGLDSFVSLVGWQSQAQVFDWMRQSDLFLMTSHHGEGWGLVVNEALSLACPVAANSLLGSAQCLIDDQRTGFLYDDDGLEDLCDRIASKSPSEFVQMGQAAHQSMQSTWSATVAAQRTINLSRHLLEDNAELAKALYSDGPCKHVA